jgi:hypothetical protein
MDDTRMIDPGEGKYKAVPADGDTRSRSAGDWLILDPDSDYICTVLSERGARALLSHLNR